MTRKTAVLVCNTGSPAAPTKEAVAKYLVEFLGDRRVVEMSPLIWQPILRMIVVPKRAQASADRYKTVWSENGSPLMAATAAIARALQRGLGEGFDVDWAMCYGTQRIEDVLPEVARRNPEKIIVLPLFAQYATQTTEAVYDAVERACKAHAIDAPIVRINQYFEHPDYIDAVAQSVRDHWKRVGKLPADGKLMMSFHSIPAVSSERGDPYESQCKQTVEKIRLALGLHAEQCVTVFQSKFGKAKWLEPFAIDTVSQLGKAGLKRLDVICPGFAADCLETLEEIATELRGFYEHAGGCGFHYIPALNACSAVISLYADLVRKAEGLDFSQHCPHIKGSPFF